MSRHDRAPPNERELRAPDLEPDDTMDDDAPQSEDVNMGYIGCLSPEVDEFASELILMAVGASGGSYGRETRSACRRIVSEVYAPPRVTAELRRRKHPYLAPGFAFDITTLDPDDGMPCFFS